MLFLYFIPYMSLNMICPCAFDFYLFGLVPALQ